MYLRKHHRLAICLSFYLFLPIFLFTVTSAAEVHMTMICDNPTPVNGEEVVISVVLTPKEDTNISAYRIRLKFDSEKLAYKSLYADFGYDDFASYVKDNLLTVIYVTTDQGFNMKAGVSQVILELNFKVLQQSNIGTMKLSAQVDGLCNYDAQEISIIGIDPINITVIQAEEANCDLTSLATDGYEITPAFSPDITQYSLEVPYSKSTIEFTAIPVDEDANVKANRKSLKSSGTSTNINLTVTSPDKKSKKVYTVTVNRLTKAETEKVDLSKNSARTNTEDNTSDNEFEDNDENADTNSNSRAPKDKADTDVESLDFNSDNLSTKNVSLPLIVMQNSFNFTFFLVASAIFIMITWLLIKKKY